MLLERFVADVLQTNAILDTFESKISLCVLKFVSLFVNLDRGPGSFDVEDATTLSWSSAAVSE